MTNPLRGIGLFEIVKRMGEGRSLSWDRPSLTGRARGARMGGRYPYNARRIDWFLGLLFGNREDVVEAELSLVEVSVFTAILLR